MVVVATNVINTSQKLFKLVHFLMTSARNYKKTLSSPKKAVMKPNSENYDLLKTSPLFEAKIRSKTLMKSH